MPKSASPQTDNGNGKKRSNPFVKKLTIDMISNTYVNPETQKVDPAFGRNFVLEKIRRSIIAPLEGITYEQWLDLANDAYKWHLDSATRDKEAEAEAILNRAMADPDVWTAMKKRLAAIEEDTQLQSSIKTKEVTLVE